VTATPRASTGPALEFKRVDIDTSRDVAEACLTFSEPLIEGPSAHYEDYVTIPDHADVAFEARGPRLCVSGLGFGQTYSVELKSGLPGASGRKLAAAESVPVTLADKAPFVRFASGAQFILPRTGNSGVPVTTLNLDEIAIKVYRISDRAIFQQRQLPAAETSLYEMQYFEQDAGTLVWSGKLRTTGRRNEVTTTAFPIRDVVKPWKPGAYVIFAATTFDRGDERPWEQKVTAQTVYDTDLGLTVFRGEGGLDVFVRSIETAKPIAGVKLSLIARNNEELGHAATDDHGHAQFAPGLLRGKGAAEPLMVEAFSPNSDDEKTKDHLGDFNKILLATTPFDLSDRGVSGRASSGRLDVYFATDRGIYRPGETVNLTTLVRDAGAFAVEKAPVSLVFHRPDGVEQSRVLLVDGGDGGSYVPFRLSPTAQRGVWTVDAVLDGSTPIGAAQFRVDDFVPQRLKVTLSSKQEALAPGDRLTVDAEVRFLYGPAASDLAGDGTLQFNLDPNPFPALANYRFGRDDEHFEAKPISLDLAKTDANGKTVATSDPLDVPKTSLPLRADIDVDIYEPGGRTTEASLSLPIHTQPLWIGLHPLFDKAVEIGKDARIEVLAVDDKGEKIARSGLKFELTRHDAHWQWYETKRGWSYEPVYTDVFVSSGTIDVAADRPTTLALPLAGWGEYRLTLTDDQTGAVSSIKFRSGYWDVGPEVSETPDKVDVVSERPKYRAGETAKLTIKPPFEADVLITIANSTLLETRELHVPADGAKIEIPVSESWGTGAYVMATAYRPLAAGKAHEPVRAVGLSWIGLDLSVRTLAVKMDLPDHLTPRQTISVPVTVGGLGDGQSARLTVAAVDEGILQLTKFESPSPGDYYYAKRQLGVEMRDDYAHLLDDRDATAGTIRTGGDASIGGGPLPAVPTKTVALFSGVVVTDKQGRARIAFDVPDFQGELRFMAVAFDRDQVGSGEAHLAVRDPVVAEATLPRFLAPGDQSRISVLIHNVEGTAGDYKLGLSASGAVAIAASNEHTVTLAVGERQILNFALSGNEVGVGTVTLNVSGPNGFAVAHDWQIAVRASQVPVTLDLSAQLQPGQTFKLDQGMTADYLPGSVHVSDTVSTWRSFNVPSLLGELDRYPYGCLEQTTSRAFPLLYFNEVAATSSVKQDKTIPERVQQAIYRVLDMQRPSGDFGLWGTRGEPAYPWLSVFAIDFLYEAKKSGYVVPQAALARGVAWLTLTSSGRARDESDFDDSNPGNQSKLAAWKAWHEARIRAYAFYVLAKMNAVNLGDLRYFHDNGLAAIDSALGYGQVGAALAMAGDRARASHAFQLAANTYDRDVSNDYYGSRLRDLAALTAAVGHAGEQGILPGLLDQLAKIDYRAGWTTTQEDAWMLIAAHTLIEQGGDLRVEIDGKPQSSHETPIHLALTDADLARGVEIANRGEKPIWNLVALEGVPRAPQAAASNGFRILREFRDLQGNVVDPSVVKQNDRIVITLEASSLDGLEHDAVLVDLLPAGWEIESIVPHGKDDETDFDWLKVTNTRMEEARDDRFVAAVNFADKRFGFQEGSDVYRVAFIVRAVTPGQYVLPAASVEDMYHPAISARTGVGATTVTTQD
ncbi:MAG TPA: alpha-2-macroglobulin, partial [Alphaproteobacteria bacterium]|nr:alpha-2-macroglobulin [Alphaproteobacteria bacterium]